ncbi:F-box/lrr-repeat protein 20 [Plakobranchus ocellatus]|uniref:F-box/lrr-repeat protein 20 n=1 Tax=Plakobranchus ocellatus TaxID=259542 RepID=A0AAV4DCJ3_9GAST|nr:F-box/lrr-repeat protein 20 [Plakobranchus ocellatus]
MQSKDDEDSSEIAQKAATIEELRVKRLAYFSSPERRLGFANQVEENPKLTPSRCKKTFTASSQLNREPDISRNSVRENSCGSFPNFFDSQAKNSSPMNFPEHNEMPRHETPFLSAGVPHIHRERNIASDSHDYDPVSVFNSYASFSDLGLSTHRPDNEPHEGNSQSELRGCIYVPSSNGPGKMAQEIFGEKTSEEMRNALGDKGFEDLMSKVNENLSHHRDQSKSSHTAKNTDQAHTSLADNKMTFKSAHNDTTNGNQQMIGPAAVYRKNNVGKNQSSIIVGTTSSDPQQPKEGEKKVLTLSRNYDQVTVPKNTRNSFSADEIYEQAFGTPQDASRAFGRHHSDHFHGHSHHSLWNDQHVDQSPPVDYHNTLRRRLSHDSAVGVSQYSPRSQPQLSPLACPPMHVPPPGYNSNHIGSPMSPHSAGPVSSPFAFHGTGHPQFFHSGQFRNPYTSAQNQYHMQSDLIQHRQAPYPPYVPQSPSAMPQSPNGFYYPPPSYNGGQYSVPRFPYGVPLHLPPPPIPPQVKPAAVHQGYPTVSASNRRNSFTLQGSEEGLARKIPHPPPTPPAIKSREGDSEIHPGLEHRRISSGGGFNPAMRAPATAHHYNWEAEGPADHYNLHRYFSSLELHHRNSVAEKSQSGTALNSSRSVDGDFYHSGDKKSLIRGMNDAGSSEDYEDGENDETASLSSGFTSVTANTTTTGKAGGVTRRLENLGVDLEHLRHLRVVDKKQDQETSDANFEKLSKGVRYCPECGTANKAYMDWCLGCGEILIGIEPSLPGQRNRQGESSINGDAATDKRSGRSSAVANRSSKSGPEQRSRGRDSSRQYDQNKLRKISNSRLVSKAEADVYTPQESPESGKGLSLSSSPVRYRREQEDTCEEPKDSGRASSNEAQEKYRTLHGESRRESEEEEEEEEGYSADDLEVMDEEDFVEEEGVEYDYQDSEPNFFEQIKDPVLRDFIISYRNKQIMKEGQKNPDMSKVSAPGTSTCHSTDQSEVYKNSSEKYDDSVKSSMELISSITGTRTSQFNISFSSDQNKVYSPSAKATNSSKADTSESAAREEDSALNGRDYEVTNHSASTYAEDNTSKKEKKRKKKRKKVEPMDVEIFGYEEIRQSRDSSRASNTHSIPLLNLQGSSEEEVLSDDEDDDDDDEDDDSGSQQDSTSDERKVDRQKYQALRNIENNEGFKSLSSGQQMQSIQSKQPSMKSKMPDTSLLNKPHIRPSSATMSSKAVSGSPSHSQSKQRNGQASVTRSSDAGVNRGGRHRQDNQPGYQRHWARSSTAWSSYHPRELSTRSSLNMTGSERNNRMFKKVGDANGSLQSNSRENFVNPSQNGPSYQNGHPRDDEQGKRSRPSSGSSVSSSGGSSGIPVRQRPSSAEYSRRVPSEPRQRPSSAQVRSNQKYVGRSRHQSQNSQDKGPPPRQQLKLNNYISTPTMRDGSKAAAGRPVPNPPRASADVSSNHIEQMSLRTPSLANTDRSQQNIRESVPEDSTASPRLLCPELHRLPQNGFNEEHADKLHAMAKNSYDKLQQMTPRISGGEVSIWQCLPDELWLYVFEFVSHGDLGRLMRSCQYFYRLTNDETLWKYITVRPKLAMKDVHLAAIAQHRPLSLAMVMCNGRDVSQDSLHNFFRETQGRLKELNICGCSQGALGGAFVLEVAAQYCQDLTHLDASYCNLTDASLEAISQCADRLESICVNGFQSMSDACLLRVLRKHGRGLRTLELYACFSLSASSLRSLGEHCTNLKRLCLGSCNKLTDSAMITLSAHLGRIEELDLRGCKNVKNDCIRKIVRNCPRLSKLVLANCPHISDLALTEIATHLKTTLRTLELCGCNNVTDQGLITLAKNCDRLISVDISSTKCSSVSVYQLASNSCSRWLETVKLSFVTPLTEASVVSLIRQCPRLKVVHVFGCSSLRNLAKLRQLNRKLSLEGDENFNFSRFSLGAVDS